MPSASWDSFSDTISLNPCYDLGRFISSLPFLVMENLSIRLVQACGRGYTICKQQGVAAGLELFSLQPRSPSTTAMLSLLWPLIVLQGLSLTVPSQVAEFCPDSWASTELAGGWMHTCFPVQQSQPPKCASCTTAAEALSYPKVTSESSGLFQFEDGQPALGRLTVSLWVIQKRQPTRKCNE